MNKLLVFTMCACVLLGFGCTSMSGNSQASGDVKTSTQAKLPDNLPSDMPVYPESKVIYSKVEATYSVFNLESSDDAATVEAWYEAQLSSWDRSTKYSYAPNGVYVAHDTTTVYYEKGNVAMTVEVTAGTSTMIRVARSVTTP